MATYGTTQNAQSIDFDASIQIPFDNISSVSASTVLASVQATIPLAQDFKVNHVAACYTAISGSPAIQIVYGTGTAGSVGSTDTAAVNGTTVFNAPVSLSASAGQTQMILPANFDVIYQESFAGNSTTGLPLTLRILTGSGDTASNLKVVLGGKNINSHSAATLMPSPDGNYGLDPSSF